MFVKYKNAKGKYEKCACLDSQCPKRDCFAPGYFQHRGCLASGGSKSSGYNDYLSCLNRDYHGCDTFLHGNDEKES